MKTRDPLRNKTVPLTPEEVVRQWFITVLTDQCSVPRGLLNSEVGFSMGGKRFRADILVWNREANPVALVECKAPEVPLTSKVLDQAGRYNMVLDLKWIILTNGRSTAVLKKIDNQFVPFGKLPTYDEMLTQ